MWNPGGHRGHHLEWGGGQASPNIVPEGKKLDLTRGEGRGHGLALWGRGHGQAPIQPCREGRGHGPTEAGGCGSVPWVTDWPSPPCGAWEVGREKCGHINGCCSSAAKFPNLRARCYGPMGHMSPVGQRLSPPGINYSPNVYQQNRNRN